MPKFSKKRALQALGEDSDPDQEDVKPAKKTKATASKSELGSGKDDDGNPYWELSAKRRVVVSEFKNMVFVNIREYYEQNGDMKPGKKGISLSVEQYQALLKAVPAINEALGERGHSAEDIDAEEAEKVKSLAKAKKELKRSKSNIEATSDEESE